MSKTGVMLVVFLMVLSTCIMPVFGDTYNNLNDITYTRYYDYADDLILQCDITNLCPRLSATSDAAWLSSMGFGGTINQSNGNVNVTGIYNNAQTIGTKVVCQDYIVYVRIANRNNYPIILDTRVLRFTPTFTVFGNYHVNHQVGFSIRDISGSLSNTVQLVEDGALVIRPLNELTYNEFIVVPALYQYDMSFILTRYDTYDANHNQTSQYLENFDYRITGITTTKPTFTQTQTSYIRDSKYLQSSIQTNTLNTYLQLVTSNSLLANIDTNLQEITDAYTSNISNITNTQSNITDTDDLVSDLHDQELMYYQQNESALNNVGLSNFSFDSNQSSGLGAVVNDFTTLWNNIGPLQIIFTFTLSMSLATYLLRHRPITNAIKKNEKK